MTKGIKFAGAIAAVALGAGAVAITLDSPQEVKYAPYPIDITDENGNSVVDATKAASPPDSWGSRVLLKGCKQAPSIRAKVGGTLLMVNIGTTKRRILNAGNMPYFTAWYPKDNWVLMTFFEPQKLIIRWVSPACPSTLAARITVSVT